MHHNELSLKLLDWIDTEYESRIKPSSSGIPVAPLTTDDDESIEESRVRLPKVPRVNLDEVSAHSGKNSRLHDESLYSQQDLSGKHGQLSNRLTPRGLAGASQSYKERRDLYKMKSSGK